MITPSRIFLATCFAALFGVVVALLLNLGVKAPLFLALFGVILLFFSLPKRVVFGSRAHLPLAIGCVLLGTAIGIWRVGQFENSLSGQTVSAFSGIVTVRGVVSSYPKETLRDVRFNLSVSGIDGKLAGGNVATTLSLDNRPPYGAILEIEGTLRAPEKFNDFNYPAYLAKDQITATLSGNEFRVIGQNGSALKHYLFGARAAIEETVVSILPFREAATLKALLLGDEGLMTKEFQDELNRSGLRHIVAISGMNISIITSILMGLGLMIGLWRKQAFILALLAIFLFVAMIGFPASAVRAAIMGVALLIAPIIGRPAGALRAVIFSAAVMTLISPYILIYDVGFQLSFLAVLGILYLDPLLKPRLSRLPRVVSEPLATTLAAQLAVLPLLISTFDYFSIVAPVSNILAVTPLPLVTIAGFIVVGAGAAWTPAGVLLGVFLFPYLFYLEYIAALFSRFPVATVTLPTSVTILGTLLWYCLLLYWIFNERKKHLRPIDLYMLRR